MTWAVEYAEEAEQDLIEIENHIADVLLEPVTAKKLVDRLIDSADSLDLFPFRHRIYDEEPWRTLGYRVFPVENFLIFYLPDEGKETVTISRFIYGARDLTVQFEPTD